MQHLYREQYENHGGDDEDHGSPSLSSLCRQRGSVLCDGGGSVDDGNLYSDVKMIVVVVV